MRNPRFHTAGHINPKSLFYDNAENDMGDSEDVTKEIAYEDTGVNDYEDDS